MSNSGASMEQQVEGDENPTSGSTAEMGEPQAPVQNVLEKIQESQAVVLDKVKANQQQFEKKLEDALCKGLEGITTIRYGEQAHEYHQEAIHEHELMRSEVLGEVNNNMQDYSNKVMNAIQTTHAQAADSTSAKFEKLATTVGQLTQVVAGQQEHMVTGFNSAIQGMSKVITEAFANLKIQNENQQGGATLVGGDHQQCGSSSERTNKASTKSRKLRARRLVDSSTSEDSEESETPPSDSEEDRPLSVQKVRSSHSTHSGGHKSNIPPFTGKETWKVWFTRFKDIAKRQGWDDEEKLDILLPKLQGEAGSFVYDQLSSKVRNNYKLLKLELKNRFRQVENPKTYSTMFAARRQKANESIESFAADLKRIYDKAYARRDSKTRDEDLLRKFLDGLQDTKAAFHVEFVKDPKNIDTAVDEVINFQEVHKKQARTIRRVDIMAESAEYLSSDEEPEYMIARASGRPTKFPTKFNHTVNSSNRPDLESKIVAMTKQLEEMKSNLRHPEQPVQSFQAPQSSGSFNQYNESSPDLTTNGWSLRHCYKCGQPGHWKRDCQVPDFPPQPAGNISGNAQTLPTQSREQPKPKSGN